MSAKETIKRIVDSFNSKPLLRDKTREMGEGLMLGASLADEANERSKAAEDTTKRTEDKYKEQILAQDLNPNKDPELVDLRNGNATAGERITKFEQETTAQFQHIDPVVSYTSKRLNGAHYDERLERWAKKSINNFYIDSNIGPINMISNLNTNSYMRHYDPETKILSFEGQEYNIQLVVDELIYIQKKGKSIPL